MKSILVAVLFIFNISIFAAEPMIVAHRGASKEAPENTIPAFKLAWEQGADAIEGDFLLTQDGKIVCIHDKTTKRTAGKELVVKDSRLDELKTLDVGAYRGEEFSGTAIPTIADVFATVPEGKKIYIEIKCGGEILPALLDEIKKSGLKDEQIVVICFNKEVIQKLKTLAPQYEAFWLCSFKKQKTGEVTPSAETVLNTLTLIQADGLSSNTAVPESLIETVRKNGYQWHVWTVDDPETAIRMKALGAKSITSNVPRAIRENRVEQNLLQATPNSAPEESRWMKNSMKRKILSIVIILATLFFMFNSITTESSSSAHVEWGAPPFFTIEYPDGLPQPYASQMHFHGRNIFITFACFSVPIFWAGYLWRKPNKKNPKKLEPTCPTPADTAND